MLQKTNKPVPILVLELLKKGGFQQLHGTAKIINKKSEE